MRWLDAHEDKDIPCEAFERLEARHRAAIKRLDDQSKAISSQRPPFSLASDKQ